MHDGIRVRVSVSMESGVGVAVVIGEMAGTGPSGVAEISERSAGAGLGGRVVSSTAIGVGGVCDGWASKSALERPRGSDGGARRWRLGVDGALSTHLRFESWDSESLADRRRLRAPRWGEGGGCSVFSARGSALEGFATEIIVGLGRNDVVVQGLRNGDCEMLVVIRLWRARQVV